MNKYALISVSDKTGIEYLAVELEKMGYNILSTSHTADYLKQFCQKVVLVSDLTGFPEILEGRVKTLHPVIYAGILADRNNPAHAKTLSELKIEHIDVIAVNLYPFASVCWKENATEQEIIENIDIGGPALIRAGAKNYKSVTVLVDPVDYAPALELLKQNSILPEKFSSYLAQKAFAKTRDYDAEIAAYFASQGIEESIANELPAQLEFAISLKRKLRYGENPHQNGGFYAKVTSGWELIHGKELSFNNIMDIDSAFRAIRLFGKPTAIIIKHCNPCGIGSDETLAEAYRKAYETDTEAPFGGIVIVNHPLDLETATLINNIFTEIIIAPAFEPNVLEFLKKKKNRRLIHYEFSLLEKPLNPVEIKTLTCGYLAQDWDLVNESTENWKIVTNKQPAPEELEALIYAWKAVSVLKSNAIAIAKKDSVLGLGCGQTSRIDAVQLALWKAKKFGHDLTDSVCASDGFFPFRDCIDTLAKNGISAIIQPGGSKNDAECISACNELNIAMVFTGFRHFKH
jgi:phosphoribosylaminoimidazolecarboxamide formyltransferase/IMP cyclohydrolase